ncbi:MULTISPECIES: lipopolysaccharide biosynthesis protein [unclassified Aureimonas]|uniref:lipopolysaccharide biosynthesis protein n=1 Tax=unclassified Aureimonas TaxID=2615206 RepID=UPI0006F8EA72|nr:MULTISPECIES: lipopolysaccharide biosynthesis protein [unclassified Aureimonas]KQT60475.1 exopolysaccharide biosynthesis protein [Aureimonas sp. Leaf427]KQT79352.1 exopolysaccharide biosynthesis protein [Aureimonas sp. Leaf460]
MTAPSTGLTHRAALASIWVVGGRFIARIIDLASLLVLARILTPADFGMVAIATTILSLVEAILELPLNQALIRQPVLTKSMFDTAFTLSLLRGAAISLIMVVVAWPLSIYYENPALFPLTAALSLAPALRGLVSPRLVIFMQEFDFRREFAIDIIAKVATLVISTSLALATGSYWALAAGTIAGPLTAMAISYILAPMTIRLTLSEWKLFQDMIGWSTLSQVISSFNWQFDRLMLPRYISVALFGAFSVADTLAGIIQQTFVAPLIRPLSAAFAKLTSDEERCSAYFSATSAVVMVAAPILTCLALLAEPALRIVVGEKWLSATPILSALAAIGLLGLPLMILGPLVVALDRTRYGAARTAIEMVVKTPVTLFGIIYYGIEGALIGRAVGGAVAYLANVLIVRHLIGMSIGMQIRSVLRPALCTLAMAGLVLAIRPLLEGQPLSLAMVVGTMAVGFVALSTFWLLIFASWYAVGRPKGLETVVMTALKGLQARLRGSIKQPAS